MRKTNKGRGFPKTHIPIKPHPVKKAVYVEQNAGIKKSIDVDSVMKAGDNPINSLTAIPWNSNPYPVDQIAAKKTVIFRPSKAQIDMTSNIKRNPTNMESGISGVGPVYPEKKSSKFMPKNSKKISVQAAPILNVEPKNEMPYLEKQWEQIPMHAGENHEVQFDGEINYAETNHRKHQDPGEQWAEANDIDEVSIRNPLPDIDKRNYNTPMYAGQNYNEQDTEYYYNPKHKKLNRNPSYQAEHNYEGEVYDDQDYHQERITNSNLEQYAHYNTDVTFNGDYTSHSQNKPYHARVEQKHADYNLDTEIESRIPIEKPKKKNQVKTEKAQIKNQVSLDIRNEVPNAKQHRKYQAAGKKVTEIDKGKVKIDDEREVKNQKRYQAKPAASKAEIEYNANSNSHSMQKSNSKHQSNVNLKSVPELVSDSRGVIPNTKFVRKQEAESSRPMMTIKMPTGDSKLRIQNALSKVNRQESAKPSNLDANLQLNQINAVRLVPEKQDKKETAKVENLNAELLLPQNRLIDPIQEQHKIESAKPTNLNPHQNFNVRMEMPLLGNHILKTNAKLESETAGFQVYDGQKPIDDTQKISGKNDNKVNGSEVEQISGKNSIIPPPMTMDQSLFEQLDSKSNLARTDEILAKSAVSISNGEKPEIKSHSKRREVLIHQDISAGSNKNVKVKTPNLTNLKRIGEI